MVVRVDCETCPARESERCAECLVQAIPLAGKGPLVFDLVEVRALQLLAEKRLVGMVPPGLEQPA